MKIIGIGNRKNLRKEMEDMERKIEKAKKQIMVLNLKENDDIIGKLHETEWLKDAYLEYESDGCYNDFDEGYIISSYLIKVSFVGYDSNNYIYITFYENEDNGDVYVTINII